jgi:hypothetical protein
MLSAIQRCHLKMPLNANSPTRIASGLSIGLALKWKKLPSQIEAAESIPRFVV